MKQDVLYDVATGDSVRELTYVVNNALSKGWELVGGVSCSKAVDQGRYEYLYSQALILPRSYKDLQ